MKADTEKATHKVVYAIERGTSGAQSFLLGAPIAGRL